VKQRAIEWKITSVDSQLTSFSFKSEPSESSTTLRASPKINTPGNGEKEKDTDEYGNKEWVEPDSLDSLPDTKSSESSPGGDSGESATPLDYAAALSMPVEDAIEIWRSEGAPVIHLGPGVNCFDVENLLTRQDVSPEHLEAVRAWLQKQKRNL